MRQLIILGIVSSFFIGSLCFAQERTRSDRRYGSSTQTEEAPAKTNKVTQSIDDANEAVSNTNETINTTNESIKATVETSKETYTGVKETFQSIFGSGGGKGKKKKGITIEIPNVDYDDEAVGHLYEALQNAKGIKKLDKSFKSGNILVFANYKKGTDALWQQVPKEVRKQFKLVEINDQGILLQRKPNE